MKQRINELIRKDSFSPQDNQSIYLRLAIVQIQIARLMKMLRFLLLVLLPQTTVAVGAIQWHVQH